MKRLTSVVFAALFVFPIFLLALDSTAQAEVYPEKDIRWVLGGAAGGGFDIYARAIGRYMEKYLPKGVHVLIENKPGAGHRIAMSTVYNAKPDGYMIGMPHQPGLYIDQMYAKQTYDMTKVTWLAMILHDTRMLCVSPKSKYKTFDELKKGQNVRIAINGFASESDLILANNRLGFKANYISGHKSSNDAALAVMRGDADACAFAPSSLKDLIRDKQLIPLAVYGAEKRLPEYPNLPTLAELGEPELNEMVGTFRSISAPPNMPADRVKILRDVIAKAMNDKEFLEMMNKADREVEYKNGEDTAKIMTNLMNGYDSLREELKPYYEKENK
jgi:tripartite-type tricarboxylate transporter receptor subunit TctC